MLQMMQAWMDPLPTDDAALGLDAIAEAGPGGHFFGTAQTMASYQTAFYQPMLSNWDNYPNWLEKGSEEAPRRANRIWKEVIAGYEEPKLDDAKAEALADYVARRKAEGGAPMN